MVAAADVNLTLRKGEILGIVGESGSGKSTVARCIVRLIEPTAGHMMMGGEDLSTLSGAALRPVRRRIQIVFQDPYRSLNPRRTVGESIIEGLLNFGVPREQALRRAGETLSVVGLSPDAMRRYPHQFSGGQRQRICIARALVMDPEILVADEAVSALDVSVQAQVLELLEQVRQRTGVGVLFITHDLRVAAQICDTIIVMQRGKVVETGSAETVLTEPRHEYTRALIDAAPGRDWDFRNFRPVAAGHPGGGLKPVARGAGHGARAAPHRIRIPSRHAEAGQTQRLIPFRNRPPGTAMQQPHELSAQELLAAYRAKTLSPSKPPAPCWRTSSAGNPA